MTPEQAAFDAFQASRAARVPMMPATAWTHPAVDAARDDWRAASQAAIARALPELADLRSQLEVVYRERARLVAFLAAVYPSQINDAPDADGWAVVYVSTPVGQMSWHIAPDDQELFDHAVADHRATWDGHTTDQKYERLAELTRTVATGIYGPQPGVVADADPGDWDDHAKANR